MSTNQEPGAVPGTNTLTHLMLLSLLLLLLTVGAEVMVLFYGYDAGVPDVVVGRVLGMLDAISMMVVVFWFGSTSGSARKTELLASAPAIVRQEGKRTDPPETDPAGNAR